MSASEPVFRIYEKSRHIYDGVLRENGWHPLVIGEFDYPAAMEIADAIHRAKPHVWVCIARYEGAGIAESNIVRDYPAPDPTE